MVNTFRYETKQTRSFIRVREIHFFEAHTAHADEADATRQIEQDLEIVDRLMDKLCLPISKQSDQYGIRFQAPLYNRYRCGYAKWSYTPSRSCHHYLDQWAKAFDITYENLEAKQQHVHQTHMECLSDCLERSSVCTAMMLD